MYISITDYRKKRGTFHFLDAFHYLLFFSGGMSFLVYVLSTSVLCADRG